MLIVRITPYSPLDKDVYTFSFSYRLACREFNVEHIFTTGEPDSAFDAMFEVAKRQIREVLPALRLGSPILFGAALREAALLIQNKLNEPVGNIMVEKP